MPPFELAAGALGDLGDGSLMIVPARDMRVMPSGDSEGAGDVGDGAPGPCGDTKPPAGGGFDTRPRGVGGREGASGSDVAAGGVAATGAALTGGALGALRNQVIWSSP